jgi:hypothetical protein
VEPLEPPGEPFEREEPLAQRRGALELPGVAGREHARPQRLDRPAGAAGEEVARLGHALGVVRGRRARGRARAGAGAELGAQAGAARRGAHPRRA